MTTPPKGAAPRLDLNILPARHRPRRVTPSTVLTWLLFLAMLALLVPSWQWFVKTTEAYEATASEGERLRGAVGLGGPAGAELDGLATQVTVTEDRATQLEAALVGLGIRQVVWSEVLPVLIERAPEGISFTGITDQGESILVEGLSQDEALPLTFARNLAVSEMFDLVRIEAIDRVSTEPEAPPTPTATPRARATTAPTPTSTPPPPPFFFSMTLVVRGASTP